VGSSLELALHDGVVEAEESSAYDQRGIRGRGSTGRGGSWCAHGPWGGIGWDRGWPEQPDAGEPSRRRWMTRGLAGFPWRMTAHGITRSSDNGSDS
jgi:hypothetical protein